MQLLEHVTPLQEVSSLFRREKRMHTNKRLRTLPWVNYYPASLDIGIFQLRLTASGLNSIINSEAGYLVDDGASTHEAIFLFVARLGGEKKLQEMMETKQSK